MKVEDIKVNTVVKVNPIPKIWGPYWDDIKTPTKGIVKEVGYAYWGEEEIKKSLITLDVKDSNGNMVERVISAEEISPYLEGVTLLALTFELTPSQFELLKDRFVIWMENEQGETEVFYSFCGDEYFEVVVEKPASDKFKEYEQLIKDTIAQEELRKKDIIVQIDYYFGDLGLSTYTYIIYHGVMPLIGSREVYFSYTDALKAGVLWGKEFLEKS